MRRDPFPEALEALFETDAGAPAQIAFDLANVEHADTLIAGPPLAEARGLDRMAGQAAQQGLKLGPDRERMLRAAANVVDLPGDGVNALEGQFVEIHQVVNVEHITHLLAIAINDNRATGLGGNHEMRRPALILDAELPWAIDRRLPKDHRGQAVDAVVIAHVLVASALGAAVGRVEIQG